MVLQSKADEEAMHQLLTKIAQMQSTIESLSYRCIYLERQQAKDREKSQKEIEDNNAQILKQVRSPSVSLLCANPMFRPPAISAQRHASFGSNNGSPAGSRFPDSI